MSGDDVRPEVITLDPKLSTAFPRGRLQTQPALRPLDVMSVSQVQVMVELLSKFSFWKQGTEELLNKPFFWEQVMEKPQNMPRCIDVNFSTYLKWLETSKMEPNDVSALAYELLQCFGRFRNLPSPREKLRRLKGSASGLEALRRWKYRPLDMDFLQFAVLCDEDIVGMYIRHAQWTEDDYKGDGVLAPATALLNHPVHLAWVLSQTRLMDLLIEHFPTPWKEGYVFIPHGGMPSLFDICRYCTGRILKVPTQEFLAEAVSEVSRHPERTDTKATIEWIWDTAAQLRSTDEGPLKRLLQKIDRERSTGDLLDFFCIVGVSRVQGFEMGSFPAVPFPLITPEVTRRMAEFLSRDVLSASIARLRHDIPRPRRYFEEPPEYFAFGYSRQPFVEEQKQLLEILQTEQRERTLQQRCFLTVLQHTEANFWRLRALDIPGGLRKLFRIPFVDLYDRLSAADDQQRPEMKLPPTKPTQTHRGQPSNERSVRAESSKETDLSAADDQQRPEMKLPPTKHTQRHRRQPSNHC